MRAASGSRQRTGSTQDPILSGRGDSQTLRKQGQFPISSSRQQDTAEPQNYTSGPLHRGGGGAGQEAWLTQLLLGFLPAPSRAPWAVVAHVPFLVVLAIS